MAGPRDYYDVLGVSRSASADELRKAHRRLARKYHPDINKDADASSKFSEVQEAYDVLSDPQKRQVYDQFGHAGVGAGVGAGQAGPSAGGPGGGTWNVNINPDDLQDIFEGLFGKGGGKGRGPRMRRNPFDPEFQTGDEIFGHASSAPGGAGTKGTDLQHTLKIGFATAAMGGVEQLRLRADGEAQTLDVRIPAGIMSGAKLRLRGKGQPGPRGGAAGDLILTIEVGEHPWFTRDGLDLLINLPVSIVEAAQGATIAVPLLKGSVKVKIPPGTSSGQKLRIRGRGITDAKGNSGDFYAIVQIVLPSSMSPKAMEIIKELEPFLSNPRQGDPWTELTEAE